MTARALSGLLSTVLATAPAGASELDRTQEGPEDPAEEVEDSVGVLSEGGRNRGALELTLGSLIVATSAAMIVFGAIELDRGLEREDQCAREFDQLCETDPPNFLYAAAGLSFGLSIPVLVGGIVLLVRGARIHRDFREVRALQSARLGARVHVAPGSGSLGLRWRF